MSSPSDTKILHRFIRFIASLSASSFFTEIRIIGGENVPKDGPIIVTATHHNMMLDPVILSVGFPHQRILNYWSKASLFKHPVAAWILYSSGNIPVDRKSKDRQKLFKGTFDALSQGEAVALFPEGTSYTEPRIMQVKDGAAWSALEYSKWKMANPGYENQPSVKIIPASIVYTNKSKYRSGVIMEFGQPISVTDFEEQFFSDVEGAPRAAVKRLTRTIEMELVETSINAPDWDTLYAARMARDILWEGDSSIKLEEFVIVSQTLVDLFSTPALLPNIKSLRRHILGYYSLLQSSHLTNSVLSSLPLPRTLDPNTPTTIPSRLFTLLLLVRDSLSALMQLPFFFVPLIVHIPVYIMGRIGARLVEEEEETQAQNKVAFGLISLLLIYSATFFFLWALFRYTPVGALLSAFLVYLFALYHTKMIDGNYERAKRIVATWRILVGVWTPKQWDLSVHALSQYLTPKTPPENPWIDRPLTPVKEESEDAKLPAQSSPPTYLTSQEEPPVKAWPVRRPPSRRLVRHVLRSRVGAVNALASLFDQLEKAGPGKKVKASAHLARLFGGTITPLNDLEPQTESGRDSHEGWRSIREVISFLRKRGAKIPTLRNGPIEGGWAALSSEGEGDSAIDEKEDLTWVPPPSGN